MKTKYDGLIFDMDGILVDVSQSYREAIRQTASYFLNRKIQMSEVNEIKNKIGMNNDWDATYALINKSVISYESVKSYFQTLYLGDDKNIGLIDNEKLLISKQELQQLKDKYKKLGIATGRPKKEAEYVIKKNRLEGIFDCIIALEDVANSKPSPDCLLAVMKKLNLKQTVYIGDSLSDVIAAKRAKIPSIFVGKQNIGTIKFQTILKVIQYLLMNKSSQISRKTNETDIDISLKINGTGVRTIDTPIGFLNHMLDLFAKHGLFDLNVKAKGDVFIDEHHTVEDIGIVLGKAFSNALGDKKGINRYGFFILPMDEALATVAIDFAGRYAFTFDCNFNREKVGDLSTELIYDFWDGFAQNAKVNLYIKVENGRNNHHKVEAIFKAVAKAVRMACEVDKRASLIIPSTKGVL